MPVANSKDKIGLVLSGGFFHGAFQVGVLEALYQRGFSAQIVVGVSSGAWNGACIVANQLSEMRNFWLQVGQMSKISLSNLFFNKTFFNLRWIVHQIPKQYLDFQKISNSETKFYVGVTKIKNFQSCFFCNHDKKENFFSILEASSWIPIFNMHPILINNNYYIDGGFTDNVPYEIAFLSGCTHVYIIVNNHRRKILKKWPREHQVPLEYQTNITIIAPEEPLPLFCNKECQIQNVMEKGYKIGQKIPFL